MSTALTPREMSELKSSVSDAVSKPEQLVDPFELAKSLGVSLATVNRLCRDRKIPVIRVGNRRRFRLGAVIAALES